MTPSQKLQRGRWAGSPDFGVRVNVATPNSQSQWRQAKSLGPGEPGTWSTIR
jgi:hypothetical protein